MNPTLKVNHKIWEGMNKPQPIIVFVGGRGSGKSIGVGDVLTFEMATKGFDIYCLREFQESLADSVHKVFKGAIEDRLSLDGWDVQQTSVIAPNGAKTTYKGANRNPDAMQSAQGYMRSWFEEAHRASQASLDKLLPTILRNPGAKCVFTANPQSSGDPFSQRFIVPYQDELDTNGFYEDKLHYICVVNWRDNPWWNDSQEDLRKWDYEHLPRAKYDWIWEGKFLDDVDNSIILSEWFDACIDAHKKLNFKPVGKKVVAHDPSDTGNDDKGLVFRHGSVILDAIFNSSGDVNEGVDWATSYSINNNADSFVWDGDGLGLSLRRQVGENLSGRGIEQILFRGSENPDNPESIYDPVDHAVSSGRANKDVFRNKRAQYYWALRDRIYNTYRAVTSGDYIDPEIMISFSSEIEHIQKLRSEVCRIPKKETGNGRIQIESKEQMMKNGISSPNMADSLIMSLAVNCRKPISAVVPPPIRPMRNRRYARAG